MSFIPENDVSHVQLIHFIIVSYWTKLIIEMFHLMSIQPNPTIILLIPQFPPKVKRGLRWGAVMGAVVGWLRALAVVDPDAWEV